MFSGDIYAFVMHAVSFDFFKTFDRYPYVPLVAKLRCIGIADPLLFVCGSILSDRFFNKIHVFASRPILSGVPPGSDLRPLLFCIYIDDISNSLLCNAFLYVVDMKIRPMIIDLVQAGIDIVTY